MPLIFQHGGAQSKRTWESSPDGREGFNTLFLRAGYAVYLVDQPRTGKSNLSTEAVTPDTYWAANPMYGDKTLYVLSRIGHYDEQGKPVPNAQFSQGEENYQAFQQSRTIGSGSLDNDLNADVLAKLFNQQKDGAIQSFVRVGYRRSYGRFSQADKNSDCALLRRLYKNRLGKCRQGQVGHRICYGGAICRGDKSSRRRRNLDSFAESRDNGQFPFPYARKK